MNGRPLYTALITTIVCASAAVCLAEGSSKPYPAANLNEDTYQPGEPWKLVWSDEFDGDTLNEKNWNRQVVKAGRFNEEWQRYTDSTDNAYVENGCLVIKAIHESDEHGHDQYTSSRLNTANKQTWKHGIIAARIQLPHGNGMWPAFWMLGANCSENGGDTPWPQCGEIDILELYGSKDDAVVEANIHYADADDKHACLEAPHYKLDRGVFADNFQVFEIEWDDWEIIWRVDGKQYASTPVSSQERAEFQKEFFILLNVAVGGTHAGRPDESTPFPQKMVVDWVRVYQQKP
jgi:beta-glucanase (GH16 family)